MPDKLLTVGMVGDEVAGLHRALAAGGFEIPETEVARRFFGPATRQAVCDSQRKRGLGVTGEVYETTISALSATNALEEAAGSSTAAELVSQPAPAAPPPPGLE